LSDAARRGCPHLNIKSAARCATALEAMSRCPPTLHVLVATIGRGGPHGLLRLLGSLEPQLHAGDALTIVYDARDDAHTRMYVAVVAHRLTQRGVAVRVEWNATNMGIGEAVRSHWGPLLERRDFVVHCDDDNVYVPGAFDRNRARIAEDRHEHGGRGDALHIFRHTYKVEQWGMATLPWVWPLLPVVSRGFVDTGDGVVPYDVNARVAWPPRNGGDGEFYAGVAQLVPRVRHWPDVTFEYRCH